MVLGAGERSFYSMRRPNFHRKISSAINAINAPDRDFAAKRSNQKRVAQTRTKHETPGDVDARRQSMFKHVETFCDPVRLNLAVAFHGFRN
ncbi:MAG: hypothetical protein KF847_06650 [Pirellulales bacterium]|nr:hypothetical protein [Pirellulales bacterium]